MVLYTAIAERQELWSMIYYSLGVDGPLHMDLLLLMYSPNAIVERQEIRSTLLYNILLIPVLVSSGVMILYYKVGST